MTILYRITFVWCFRPVRLREAAYVTLKAESRDLSDVKTVLKGCVNAQPELVNQTQLLKNRLFQHLRTVTVIVRYMQSRRSD
jgi:hypothetical protein